jgi:hypothetical protein
MRNRFNEPRRGRRPDRSGSAPINSSPYDFGSADDDQVDPIDLMAIRADDELLDALASGEVSLGGFGSRVERDLDGGFRDDRQMLAMLAAWRDEVLDGPAPELVSVERASEAIVAGQRSVYPKRRLMPVAAAAAAVVLGLSGVAIGAGAAEPGDPLWGVSKSLNSDRAESKEAAQRVTVALASVQQALDEGRVKDAQATLAAVAPELDKVKDEQTKQELAEKQANLAETAGDAKEGEKVHTDESGKRDDAKGNAGKDKDPSGHSSSSKPGDPKQGVQGDKDSDSRGQANSTSAPDQRRSAATSTTKPATPPASSADDKPPPNTTTEPKPEPETKPDSTKPDSTKPDSTKPDSTKPDSTKPDSNKKKDGEGGPATSTSTPTAAGPPPPPPQFLAPVGP